MSVSRVPGAGGGSVIGVDPCGRVAWMSAEAEALLGGVGLDLRGRSLVARDGADQRRLEDLIARAARGASGEAIICDEAGDGLLVQASARGGGAWLRLFDLRPPQGAAGRLAALFGLTPAEARLADALLAGLDPADCARRFGVSVSTIRSQLAALFDKTGRRRQSALLVLLTAVAAPGFGEPPALADAAA